MPNVVALLMLTLYSKPYARKISIAWSAMIAACVTCDHPTSAIKIFQLMERENIKLDPVSSSFLLTACAELKDLLIAKQIHGSITRSGITLDASLESGLVHMYAKCGSLED